MAKLDTPLRLAHFLGQTAHESAYFTKVVENLNYTTPERLCAIFPSRFKTVRDAQLYVRNPERLGNLIYANRMGNGSVQSGDGYKYRGRGYIMLTGAVQYLLFGQKVGVKLLQEPDLVATKYPLTSAAWFWNRNDINKVADLNDIVKVTLRVNGGKIGLEDRIKSFTKFYDILSE
jgi:putative chitinase